MFLKLQLLVLLANFVYSLSAVSVSFIDKCKIEDTKCLKLSTQKAIPYFANGFPEYNVKKSDPFFMKYVDASSPTLKLTLKDLSGTGLKDCVAKKVEIDKPNTKLILKLLCTVDAKGKYDMKGQLLLLPIEGKGDIHVVLRKLAILGDIELKEETRSDGQKYYAIKNWKHEYDLKDKSTIELENLFNGNEVLGRAARELIANSSNEIIKEVGPPIVKAIVTDIVENVKNFFEHVPASELTLD